MSVTTSLCTVLCCCNLTRKGTKVSMKIKYCTAQRVCETLRARVCVVCTKWKGDGDGAVHVLTRWGPLSCGLIECSGRWWCSAPLVAVSSFCCSLGSLLPSLPLWLCLDLFSRTLDISDRGRLLRAPLCRYCTALMTRSRAQRERSNAVRAWMDGAA